MKVTIGRMLKKREASDGALTPFQAVCTALAATVGTGNIAVWQEQSRSEARVQSSGCGYQHFLECVQVFRSNACGTFPGEKRGRRSGRRTYVLHKKWTEEAMALAGLSVRGICVLTVFGRGMQHRSIPSRTAIDSALYNYGVISEQNVSTLNLVIRIILAVLIGLILLGGIKRIGQVAEKLVPFMAVIYIILAIGVVILNYRNIPTVFASIFKGAFHPHL